MTSFWVPKNICESNFELRKIMVLKITKQTSDLHKSTLKFSQCSYFLYQLKFTNLPLQIYELLSEVRDSGVCFAAWGRRGFVVVYKG